MTSIEFFKKFFEAVKTSPQWKIMTETVEGSEWHREANVAVHTEMCIDHYLSTTAADRSERHQMLTLMTLLFHDFGKPEAEETVERKDGSGTTYHRYAGHEPVSANEFLSFMCDQKELTKSFFDQGYGWADVRKIKFMIEQHLPYGLKNPQKRMNLKRACVDILGDDEHCFYDQLWSDCNGRISDDHEAKRQRTLDWIAEWEVQAPAAPICAHPKVTPYMYVLIGPVGAGKSTWVKNWKKQVPNGVVISEDEYRVQFHRDQSEMGWDLEFAQKSEAEKYDVAWKYCAFVNPKGYEAYVKTQVQAAIDSGHSIVLDRTNATRKGRRRFIENAKQTKQYKIVAVEFYVSEKTSVDRQETRGDKFVHPKRVHQMYMQFEVPWVGVEVHDAWIIAPWE